MLRTKTTCTFSTSQLPKVLRTCGACAVSTSKSTACKFSFPRASECRVLPIVGVCLSSSHLHIFSSSHVLILTSSHLHIFSSSSHIHILTSSHLLIFTSSHLHILTSSHPHIFTSSHSLLPFCSLALLLSCPLLFPSFLFLP